MELLYKAELRGETLYVRLEERGAPRKVLYLDTISKLAQEVDKPALSLLVKLRPISFQNIVVPRVYRKEAIRLMQATGRLSGLPIAKEEAPLILKPKLVLSDANGACANLVMDYGKAEVPFEDFAPTVLGRPRYKEQEKQLEKDLLEVGFTRKMVGASHYYAPTDLVKKALRLLLEVGWQIIDYRGRLVRLQNDLQIEVTEEGEALILRARGIFGDQVTPVKSASLLFMELPDGSVGLLDKRVEVQGLWDGEKLVLRKSQIGALIPLLGQGHWDEKVKKLAEGLGSGIGVEEALPGEDFTGTLLPYQQRGVDWLSFLYKYGFSGLLADEMGLGKTVQVLAFLSRLRTNLPILVVAPTSLTFNWRAEIARFLPGKNIEITTYTQLRINALEFSQREFEAVVLDESNAIKTRSTQTAQAAFKLRARFKVALSGTPMENRPEELLSQFQFLMPDLIDKSGLEEKARPFILRRRKEEVALELPEKIEQIVWLDMDAPQKALYDEVRQKEGAILERILRTRQVCCDPRLVGSTFEGPKFKQLVSDVQEVLAEGHKVLVYSQFTSMLALIRQEFPDCSYLDGSIEAAARGRIVEEFQQAEGAKLFLLSLKAGGVGLNLTAADYVFLFDPWWNDAVEMQAIDRAHRIGRKKTVIAKRYLMMGTVEEKMLELKRKKSEHASQLLDFTEKEWTHEELLYLLS